MTTEPRSLEQIRKRLLNRRLELQQRGSRVGRDLSRQLDPLSSDASDRAIQLENDESLHAIGEAALSEIEDIDVALDRLERGYYGICKVCGDEIAPARLAAVPQASTCQECGQN
jgi:RNA polymerase-binding transcription factor DksA